MYAKIIKKEDPANKVNKEDSADKINEKYYVSKVENNSIEVQSGNILPNNILFDINIILDPSFFDIGPPLPPLLVLSALFENKINNTLLTLPTLFTLFALFKDELYK